MLPRTRFDGAEARRGNDDDRAPHPHLASDLVLTTVLALAGVALLMALVLLVVDPEPVVVPGTIELEARQGAETFLYGAAFFVILPLSLLIGPKVVASIGAGPNAGALPYLPLLLASALAAVVALVRLADQLGWNRSGALLGVMVAWWIAAGIILHHAARDRHWPLLQRISRATTPLWIAGAALVLVALATVTHAESVSPIPVLIGLAGVPLVLFVFARRRVPSLRRPWGALADAAICAITLMVVADLVFITPEDPGRSLLDRLKDVTMVFHQTFLLGPANQLLGGHTMLIDNASQYGVGSIYFLAGWFSVAPIGYGTMALLDSLLTGLYLIAGYALLRICGASRPIAGATIAVAVAVMVFSLTYPLGGLVQEGPFRFGIPLLLILTLVAAHRWPQLKRAGRVTGLTLLGVASLWALEAFAYTAFTFAAMACLESYFTSADRVRWLAQQAAWAVGACIAAHLLFAAATWGFAGELPHWDQYLVFLKGFLLGELGEITYDFSPWSPALAVGAGYVTSVVGLLLVARRIPASARRERTIVLAIGGTTAYGIAFFAYFVNRSEPHVLAYCCLPLFLLGALWLTLIRQHDRGLPSRSTVAALGASLTLSVLLTVVAWPFLGPGFERSALAHAIPGNDSFRGALQRLWRFPPFEPRAPEGERLLERYMSGERDSVVLVQPGLDAEILMRSGRSNALPLGTAVGESFVADARESLVQAAIDGLRPGDRMLLDRSQLAALRTAHEGNEGGVIDGFGDTAPLQVRALVEIDRRFAIRPVHSTPSGFVVVELAAPH